MRVRGVALTIAAVLLGAAHGALAESEKFLCIDGVEGDSADVKFEGCSDLTGYQQTIRAPGDKEPRCSAVATKMIDSASPAIWTRAANKTSFPNVSVVFRTSGERPFEFFTAEMVDVLVERVVNAEDTSGGSMDVETITLLPASMQLEFRPQDEAGGLTSPITANINCTSGKK